MIHRCKVNCHTINPTEMDLLGFNDDNGKWLPFAIDLGVVTAAKMSTDDIEEPTYNCTSVFTNTGDTFILDTHYLDFMNKWESYVNTMDEGIDLNLSLDDDDDVNL